MPGIEVAGIFENVPLKKRVTVRTNEKGRKVEADVAMCPLHSLFRREENRDGVACVPYALHSY